MNRKRKMLIAILLVAMILLNCVMPTFTVGAATAGKITFEKNLYEALKDELTRQGINAAYIDGQRSIVISADEAAKVTTLSLSNRELTDLTGLENFVNLTTLDLSSNNLDKDSNLQVLDTFNLTTLDLSSNEIEDVSMITKLDSIPDINLHNQKFDIVQVVELDTSTESDQVSKVSFALPQILSRAGFLKTEWLIEEATGSARIDWNNFDHKNIKVEVALKTDSAYVAYKSLVTLRVRISDSTNELYNSDINIFFVITDSDERGIHIPDENLYKAIKEQLTKNQTVNPDLISHVNTTPESLKRTLYERAYDEPQILVITIDDIINRISNLQLSNKKIKELDGLEKFVGLETNLDLSGNYIKTIDKLIELQENQIAEEAKLRERVNKQLELVSESATAVENARKGLEEKAKAKAEALKKKAELETKVANLEVELADLQSKKAAATTADEIAKFDEQIKAKQAEITKAVEEINAQEKIVGDSDLETIKLQTEYQKHSSMLITRMTRLYTIYNRVDKLSSFATGELKTATVNELTNLTFEEAKSMYNNQVNRIAEIEKTFTDFEEAYLLGEFNIPTEVTTEVEKTIQNPDGTTSKITETVTEEIENPIGKYFKELATEEWTISNYKRYLSEFRTIDAYFSMTSYCYLLRYFDKTTDCVADKYIETEIERLSFDGESTSYLESAKNEYDEVIAKYNYVCSGNTDVSMLIDYAIRMSLSKEDVDEYICLPRLKSVNVSENLIENIDRIAELTELREFYAYDNEIVDISTVDWASMTKLRILDLGFNGISDIYPLEALVNIQELYLTRNLISGSFTFDISKLEKLRVLDVSSNQIDDIEQLINHLIYEARDAGYDDLAKFLRESNILTVRFHSQSLTMNVDKKFEYGEKAKVDLPKIFRQIEEIDYANTSFGINSLNGNVTSDGKQVILDTSREGDLLAQVTIINTKLTQSLGSGTVCTISYNVGDVEPTTVTITPEEVNMIPGGTQQFTAEVTGDNVTYTGVTWTVDGATSAETKISEEGLLTVGGDEAAESLIVRATSVYDETKAAEALVTIAPKQVTEVILTPESATILKGDSVEFTATVNGLGLEETDTEVIWAVLVNEENPNPAEGTSAVPSGNKLTLTVSPEETITTFIVEAKSKLDNTKVATATVTVEERTVSSISISPATASVQKGKTQKFSAIVNGENLRAEDKKVTYTVTGNNSNNTKITSDGVLTVGSDETATTIKVVATSNYNNSKKVEATVTVTSPTVSSNLGYTVEDEYIIGVATKTPVSEFKTKLAKDYKVIVKENGSEVTSGYMKTGMFVEVQDSNGNTVQDENGDLLVFEIVVKGDVNSDGVADALDSNYIKALRNEMVELAEAQIKAADIDGNNTVNITDSKLLLYHRAEVESYSLDYTK